MPMSFSPATFICSGALWDLGRAGFQPGWISAMTGEFGRMLKGCKNFVMNDHGISSHSQINHFQTISLLIKETTHFINLHRSPGKESIPVFLWLLL